MSTGVDIWTPIEEGRFHLRSMQKGELIKPYIRRCHPGINKDATNAEVRRIVPLINMAKDEAFQLAKIKTLRALLKQALSIGDAAYDEGWIKAKYGRKPDEFGTTAAQCHKAWLSIYNCIRKELKDERTRKS